MRIGRLPIETMSAKLAGIVVGNHNENEEASKMDTIILITTGILIIAYLIFAIYSIVTSDSISEGIGLTLAFVAGSCVLFTVASFLATIVCWGTVILIILAIVGVIMDNM